MNPKLMALVADFTANALANAKALLRLSQALDYHEVDTPDGTIAAVLNLAAEKLEAGKTLKRSEGR